MSPLPGADGRRPHPATITLAALMAAAALLLLYAGRHLTFFYDEWSFILDRRGGSLHDYLNPHNGHLSLVPVAIYKLLFALVGLRHYTPYRAVDIALHLVCVGLLYVLVRRRLGPWLALVPAALLLFLGSAWQDLLWPFQIGYLVSLAAGLGAIALLDRDPPTSDAWATALLVVSVCSSGVGIALLLAVAALLVASGSAWRRLWIVAVPAAVFVAWYIGWGNGEPITTASVLGTPQFVADAASTGVAGIGGLSGSWGPPLATAALVALALRSRGERPVPLVIAALVGALAFWALAGVRREPYADPTASRYVYVSAALMLLIAAEMTRGLVVRHGWLVVGGVLLAGALFANLGQLRTQERNLRRGDDAVRAALAGVEISAPVVAPAFAPDFYDAPAVTAARYLAAVRDLGSPALSVSQLQRAPESGRLKADSVLVAADRLAGTRISSPRAGCQPGFAISELPPGHSLVLIAPRGGADRVFVRRFADQLQPNPVATAAGGHGLMIGFPSDRAPAVPWRLQVTGARPAAVCVR